MKPDIDGLASELTFKTSRSSGKGGQNVNKVSSKVELNFNIESSSFLSEEQKETLHKKLENRITKEGILRIVAQASRSQLENKEKAVKKFFVLLEKAFKKEKPRKATRPSKAAKEKGLKEKKLKSERKELRKIKY